MFISLKRVCRSGWLNFRRQGGLTIATIFILVITILQVSSLLLFHQFSQLLISNLKDKADISVYFKPESSEEDILGIKEKVSKIPEVKDVEYVSKEKALEKFIQQHKEEPLLMESLAELGKNPFLASLSIMAREPSLYGQVVDFLEKNSSRQLIEKIDYYQRKTVLEKIAAISKGVGQAEIVFTIVFGLIAVFVAFNAIRLAIYSMREEISIMRLVGASNWFVRGPFLIQGLIAGFFAALIAFLLSLIICYFLSPKIESFFFDINLFRYFLFNFFSILLLQIAVGVGLGALSSIIAMKKYLKV